MTRVRAFGRWSDACAQPRQNPGVKATQPTLQTTHSLTTLSLGLPSPGPSPRARHTFLLRVSHDNTRHAAPASSTNPPRDRLVSGASFSHPPRFRGQPRIRPRPGPALRPCP
eukprot:scaffold244_cov416-Prasinococcus_capsulatus_cf.AAC.17